MIIRSIFTIAIFLTLTFFAIGGTKAEAFAVKASGADCTSCHTLDKAEAAKILKVERFKATVKGVEMSEVKGLWEVSLSINNKEVKVYVDFAKKYLVEGRFTELAGLGKPKELRKIDLTKIPLDDAIIMGNKDASTRVIVFDDPDCPYCRKLHGELKTLIEKNKDIVFYIKQMPLSIHPAAYAKSKTLVCTKSLDLLDDAFAGKEIPAPECETDAVDKNILLAQELGINGTPGIVFPNGAVLPGYVDAATLTQLIEDNK